MLRQKRTRSILLFLFDDYVRHKQSFGFHDLTCLSVNLTRQKLNSLENFLLTSSEDKHWINNDVYFKGIEAKYKIKESWLNLFRMKSVKSVKSEVHVVP